MHETRLHEDLVQRGYCIVPAVLPKKMVNDALNIINKLVSQQSPEEKKAHRSLGTLISTWRDPFFIDLITNPETLNTLAKIGYPSSRFSNGYIFQKAGRSPPTFWHQDWWLWNDPASYTPFIHQIGLMYYLTDTTKENGCLRVIPGSHRKRHPLHSLLEQANTLELRKAENSDSVLFQSTHDEVAVPVHAGDLIIMDARLLHGAYANQTDAPRSLVNCWYFPTYPKLSEEVKSAIGCTHPPKEWPATDCERLQPYLPDYSGNAKPLELCLHPTKI